MTNIINGETTMAENKKALPRPPKVFAGIMCTIIGLSAICLIGFIEVNSYMMRAISICELSMGVWAYFTLKGHTWGRGVLSVVLLIAILDHILGALELESYRANAFLWIVTFLEILGALAVWMPTVNNWFSCLNYIKRNERE